MGGSSSQTIGYRYYLGLHMAICHGPTASVNRIYVGKRLAWEGSVTSSGEIDIFKPDLFGGDKKEGGIAGRVDIMFGESDQQPNAYLQTQLGDVPAYRGVLSLVFRQGSFTAPGRFGRFSPLYNSSGSGGYIASMSPYPKAWAVETTDIPAPGFNSAKANINNGSANGANIIYDCMTNPDWGLGHGQDNFDLPSFIAASDTLFDEGFGMSLMYNQQSPMESFILEIQNTINSVLYTDRTTGRFKLTLVRDDYDINTLKEFNETNIASFDSFERPAFAELVNEVVIRYRRRGDLEDSSITLQDLASVQAQGGVISQTLDFTGVDSDEIASRVGIRELRQSSTPLARVRFIANRDAWDVNPGDVIKLSWGQLGIESLIIRITEMDYGTLETGLVNINGVEDVFGLPTNSYFTPVQTGWADGVQAPLPSPESFTYEAPYYVLATTFPPGVFNEVTPASAYLHAVAQRPNQAIFGYQLATRQGADPFVQVIAGEFTPFARLVGPLDRETETGICIHRLYRRRI